MTTARVLECPVCGSQLTYEVERLEGSIWHCEKCNVYYLARIRYHSTIERKE